MRALVVTAPGVSDSAVDPAADQFVRYGRGEHLDWANASVLAWCRAARNLIVSSILRLLRRGFPPAPRGVGNPDVEANWIAVGGEYQAQPLEPLCHS